MEDKQKNIKILFKTHTTNTKYKKFEGIAPNKLGNIIYIEGENSKPKTKSNRLVLPIYQDEEFTCYFRLQGINKKTY